MEIITDVQKEMLDKSELAYKLYHKEFHHIFSLQPTAGIQNDDSLKEGFSNFNNLFLEYITAMLDEIEEKGSLDLESVHRFDEFMMKGYLIALDGVFREDLSVKDVLSIDNELVSNFAKITLLSQLEAVSPSNRNFTNLYYHISKEYLRFHSLLELIVLKKRYMRFLFAEQFSRLSEVYEDEGVEAVIRILNTETPLLLDQTVVKSKSGRWNHLGIHDERYPYSILGVVMNNENEFHHVKWVIQELLVDFEDPIYPSPALIRIIQSAYADYFSATDSTTLASYEDLIFSNFKEKNFIFMDDFDVYPEPSIQLQALILNQFGSKVLHHERLENSLILPSVAVPDRDGDTYANFFFQENEDRFVAYKDGYIDEAIIIPKKKVNGGYNYIHFLQELMPFV